MVESAGRRNILRDLESCTLTDRGVGSSFYNATHLPKTTTSPEENIIEHRGLKTKTATYKYDTSDPVFFKTPTKSPKKTSIHQRLTSPAKTPVRSSPRKRHHINMTPDSSLFFYEEGFAEISLSPKRVKKEYFKNIKPCDNFEQNLKALNQSQLAELLANILKANPNLKEVVKKLAPEPDLTQIEARLHCLLRTVHKSLPRNVLGSQDSSFTFLRVRTHLEAFKKECLDYCDQLLESQHWPTFFEYIFIALKHTILLPEWGSVAHNRVKNMCLKQLSSKCIQALQDAKLDRMALTELINRMKPFDQESLVKSCIDAATSLLAKSLFKLAHLHHS